MLPKFALAVAVASPPVPAPPVSAEHDPTSNISIAWSASPECNGDEALRTQLRRLLASSSHTTQASGTVDVTLTPSPPLTGAPRDSWTMTLRVSSREGSWSRQIDDESCGRMIEVAALIVAINLDPVATQATLFVANPSTTKRSESAPDVPTALPTRRKEQAQENPPRRLQTSQETGDRSPTTRRLSSADTHTDAQRSPGLGVAARVAILGSYGPFPDLGVLIVGGLGLTINGRILIELAAFHRIRSRHALEAVPQVELLTNLSGARLDACWTPHRRALELPLCAGLDLGSLRVEALGLRNSVTDRSAYVAPHLSGRLLWRPSPTVGLGLDLGLSVALLQRTYGIRELDETVFETTRIGAHAGLSLEIRLP